jgi:gamma-glutamyltranspeptidase/glutathione hydrolase
MTGAPWPATPPARGRGGMVATSQRAATEAGVEVLRRGGNAVDAAVTCGAVLSVVEPMATGLGGDLFAIVHGPAGPEGLDAAGPAPAGADPDAPVAARGPRSVTVPGAAGGWAALLDRHGTWGLDACLAPAIDLAEGGFPLGRNAARIWGEAVSVPAPFVPTPRGGEHIVLPDLAASLRTVAAEGPGAIYSGRIAEAIAAACWLTEADLAAYRPRWVEPLRLAWRGVEVLELPPPTQGVAALEALALREELGGDLGAEVTAAALALADAAAHVRDGADVTALLDPAFLRDRAGRTARPVADPAGGTTYLGVVDADGLAVSFIQSVFQHFGSGLVAEGTGIVLNNRAACFATQGGTVPGRRPYNTTIPGLLLRDGALLGPFGIMGGFIQAQAHMQVVARLVVAGLDPQAALARPRFCLDLDGVHLERGLWDRAGEVRAAGFEPVPDERITIFGGGQAIVTREDGLEGGSDPRKDGCALAVEPL